MDANQGESKDQWLLDGTLGILVAYNLIFIADVISGGAIWGQWATAVMAFINERRGWVTLFECIAALSLFADLVVRFDAYEARWRNGRIAVDVATAEVIAPRDLGEIVRDIQALGYDEREYRTSGIDALTSPITFLYEQFNRLEQSKREVARLENEDRRRALLRELLGKYVDYDIVRLEPSEFERFLDFMDPGEAVLKALTQYEFILWTRERFTAFKASRQRMEDADYEYQWDD